MSYLVEIRDSFLITDHLFHRILSNILANPANEFVQKLQYDSHVDDSLVYVLSHKDEDLSITRLGENEILLKIKGSKSIIKKFIQLMAAEGATIVCDELCKSAFSEETYEKFAKSLHKNMKEGIEKTFTECTNKLDIEEELN